VKNEAANAAHPGFRLFHPWRGSIQIGRGAEFVDFKPEAESTRKPGAVFGNRRDMEPVPN
jgi:hypothetical protein